MIPITLSQLINVSFQSWLHTILCKASTESSGTFTESLPLYASLALGDANDLISNMSVFAFREVLSAQNKTG